MGRIDPRHTRPDPNNRNWTKPRTCGVWDVGPNTGRRFRLGNIPVRGAELQRGSGAAGLVALYDNRRESHQDASRRKGAERHARAGRKWRKSTDVARWIFQVSRSGEPHMPLYVVSLFDNTKTCKGRWPRVRPLLPAVLAACLASCDSALDNIERSSRDLRGCQIDQSLPEECSRQDRALKQALLRAEAEGVEQRQILAARELGIATVEGDPEQSAYERVRASIERSELRLQAVEENHLPFSDLYQCKDLQDRNLMRLVVSSRRGNEAYLVLSPIPDPVDELLWLLGEGEPNRAPCLALDEEPIDPIVLTATQIKELSREPRRSSLFGDTVNVTVFLATSIADARSIYESSVRLRRFEVVAQPSDAHIAIAKGEDPPLALPLSWGLQYTPRMELFPGTYTIRVSHASYVTRTIRVAVSGNDRSVPVQLSPRDVVVECNESVESTVRISHHRLKQIGVCEYSVASEYGSPLQYLRLNQLDLTNSHANLGLVRLDVDFIYRNGTGETIDLAKGKVVPSSPTADLLRTREGAQASYVSYLRPESAGQARLDAPLRGSAREVRSVGINVRHLNFVRLESPDVEVWTLGTK